MAKGNHSFSEREIHSRFGAIVGHTVAEVDTAGVLATSKASRNKGRIGAIIEQSVLGYPADSDCRPDILIDGQPWEVKATGLVEGARGGWRAKEPMSITAVAPEGIVAESFHTSSFWHKAERLLVVYYLYVRPGRGVAVEYAGFEFKGYDLHTWREVDRCRLEADWTTVREFVRTALEGAMSFPDSIEKPSRTILTGEGGAGASRFKHVIECPDGRFRRLVPDELDQLQGFPKGWTDTGMTDGHRAFCMGNALVTGVPHRIGKAMVEVYSL